MTVERTDTGLAKLPVASTTASASNGLKHFLAANGKEKFHASLDGAGVHTVEDLRATSVNDLAEAGVPKSIARVLQKKAAAEAAATVAKDADPQSAASDKSDAAQALPASSLKDSSNGVKGAAADDDVPSLESFLRGIRKESFLGKLNAADIRTLPDLSDASFDDLVLVLPHTVARVLQRKAAAACGKAAPSTIAVGNRRRQQEQEVSLESFLDGIGKRKYLDKLRSGGIGTVEDLCSATLDDVSGLVPKTIARLLQKKAKECISSQLPDICVKATAAPVVVPQEPQQDGLSLESFLEGIGKQKFLDKLRAGDIATTEDLYSASLDDVSQLVPKTIARLLQKKAKEQISVQRSGGGGAHDTKKKRGPVIDRIFSNDFIAEIRVIWDKMKHSRLSFGKAFYEKLMFMTSDVRDLFGGVSLTVLGRDFDGAMEKFVALLGDRDAFRLARDGFVGRLARYGVLAKTLWLGVDAFVFAACLLVPQLELQHDIKKWRAFYQAIIPAFHPSVLKLTVCPALVPTGNAAEAIISDVEHALSLRGRVFFVKFMQENPRFLPRLLEAASKFKAWMKGDGSWDAFEAACRHILTFDISIDHSLDLIINEFPHAMGTIQQVPNAEWRLFLSIVAAQIFGVDAAIESYRGSQNELVRDIWTNIYARVSDQFSANFYKDFTKDPQVEKIFERTDLSMQRQRFVHQLNAIIIRINEGREVLRPLLLELGARHRVHFLIGLNAMLSVNSSIMATAQAMIGAVSWTNQMRDAWGYVISTISYYMIIGWTSGVSLIDYEKPVVVQWEQAFSADWVSVDIGLLQRFRDDNRESFTHFFESFAAKVSNSHQAAAAQRYESVVHLLLDEPDLSLSRESLGSLGARHRKHHGLTERHIKSASPLWMSTGKETWGVKFNYDVALNWARLWNMIATSFVSPEYASTTKGNKSSMGSNVDLLGDGESTSIARNKSFMSVEELMKPTGQQKRPSVHLSSVYKMKEAKSELTLLDKTTMKGRVAHLLFDCKPPIKFRAGQYAKIRWTTPDGKNKTRFYSIASAPGTDGMATSIELCIKEVSGGKTSPFIVGEFVPPSSCRLLLTAGYFVLPDPLRRVSRLMISGGIGIVAFIGIIRYAAGMCRSGMLKSKISLTLLHSDRTLPFVFSEELFALSKEFGANSLKMFIFELILCITRGVEGDVVAATEMNPQVTIKTARPSLEIIKNAIADLSSLQPHIFVCGPGKFQKTIREHVLYGCGHPKKLLHQEFFDL